MTTPHLPQTAPDGALRRRTFTRGAAWTIPAVAVVGAAPSASASEPPVYAYDFAGISATGAPGQTLTCEEGPGARIRTAGTGEPVVGQRVHVSYVEGPFTLLDSDAITDATGAARVRVRFDDDAAVPTLGAVIASWTGLDGNSYEAIVDVSTA
ncbi:hypothetical protein HQQ81_07330 [Microbacteriaceae bacterium VKM Ac-2854]|nr:hypothetical protein [Microbacteriaceae bacterium VKM Ac-2854]